MADCFRSAKDVLAEHERRSLPENFCLVPFTSLILEPDGSVGCCRHKGAEFPVGDIREQSLEEIWNGDFMRQWRREFLSGEPKICETEVRHRACNLCPSYNSMLSDIELSEFQTKGPIRLGLNFNGQCNLECQMCHIWQKPNGLYDSIGFWEKLPGIIPTLKEVELLSGEPFIQKDTYRLIDLISERNPDCLWSITSNAHWRLTDKLKASLDRIRFKNLIISLDSLEPETYSKIRKGGKLEVPLENLDRLLAYEEERIARGLSPLHIRINFLIQRDNWKELGSFHRFGLKKRVEIFRTFLYEPDQLSLLTLDLAERERILEFYLQDLSTDELNHSMRILVPLLDSLPAVSRASYLLRLRDRRPGKSQRPAAISPEFPLY